MSDIDERIRMEKFYHELLKDRNIAVTWARKKDDSYHAQYANDAWAAWQAAQHHLIVRAKPLSWHGDESHQYDDNWGFWIDSRDRDDPEQPFTAGWGEGDSCSFATMDEAKLWCQTLADAHIGNVAEITLGNETQQPAAKGEAS